MVYLPSHLRDNTHMTQSKADTEKLLENCISDKKAESIDYVNLCHFARNYREEIMTLVNIDVSEFIEDVFAGNERVALRAVKVLYGIIYPIRAQISKVIYPET